MFEPVPMAREQWSRDGFVIARGFLSPARCARLRELCDQTLVEWRRQHPPSHHETTNTAFLANADLWPGKLADRIEFLELVADPRIIELVGPVAGQQVFFKNTQYFVDPPTKSWQGVWHRDTQFDAWDDDAERSAMNAFVGAHFRIALVDDDHLELVPGSHDRFDTAAEYAIRKSTDPARRSSPGMPGAERVQLRVGDALLFHAWMIHRGRYRAGTPRRTLDLVLGWGDRFPDLGGGPLDDAIFQKLTPPARTFYRPPP